MTTGANVTVLDDSHETLLQFLCRAPIGLVQTTIAGDVELITPMSASLLLPLSHDGRLNNLFTVLATVAPQLQQLVAAVDRPSGIVCEALRIPLPAATPGDAVPRVLSLAVLKVNDTRLVAVIADATLDVAGEETQLSPALGAAARVDPLTRMPTRLVALEEIRSAMARAPRRAGYESALLHIDCDRLKQINDSLGRATGDSLLSLIAERIRSTLRSRIRGGHTAAGTPMAARIGGDEFAVVLDDLLQQDDVYAVAQRLIDALAQPYMVGAHKLHCSVSMGIVLRNSAAGDADAVLQDASMATEEAKRAGGGCYALFAPAMHVRATERGRVEADLRRALTDDQLFVVYQPVVGLQGHTGGGIDRQAGVEALVRWRHPTRGDILPGSFIGVAEESGLIDSIGEFVLATACRQFVQWQTVLGTGSPRTLAVNVSRGQLGQPGLVAFVAGILSASGMHPSQLQLELTESLPAQGEAVQARLHELKELGLALALDDFGTGYSSLSSLQQFPVDTVKIDRSFVSQADSSLHHRVLIDATIRVAHSLGMTTVAEGIESHAQSNVVKELGCDKGQGYLFSKPLLAADVVTWLTR
jgi:diguanylate cyclase (GGDEF)-like protein